MAALGAAPVEYSGSGLGGHANEEAVDLATTAAVRLECALRHDVCPVSSLEDVCSPCSRDPDRICESPMPGKGHLRGHEDQLGSKS